MIVMTAAIITFSACKKTIDEPVDNLPNISGYPIVGTNQTTFFNNTTSISKQVAGDDFYGQNANYPGNIPQYIDNGDGTITDMVTGLMWEE